MTINIRCGRCKHVFTGAGALAGQQIKCPQCGAALQVAGASAPPSPASSAIRGVAGPSPAASEDPDELYSLAEGNDRAVPRALGGPAPSSCPHCNAALTPDAILCVQCGFHLQLGRRLETEKDRPLSAAEAALARAEAALDGEELYVPPGELPPPPASVKGTPFLGIVAGLAAAVVGGIALFAASRLVYIYILYNVFAGTAIGWAIGLAPRRSKYADTPILFVGTLICSLLTYLSFNIALFAYMLSVIGLPADVEPFEVVLGFFAFLAVRAQEEPFIGGAQIGAVGNAIVWFVEIAITFGSAWQIVYGAIHACRLESVPYKVAKFVLRMRAQGMDDTTVARELSARGWIDPEDQQRAVQAAASLAAIQAAEADEE
jgi:hypothetical protein